MFELGAIFSGLSSEDVSEDGNNDVVGVVLGVLDDGVSEEEFNSDILEAVGGQQESNTFPFNGISDLGGSLGALALVQHLLSFFHKGQNFNLEFKVSVLRLRKIYILELFELGINFGLDEVKSLGSAVILSDELAVLVEGRSQKADEEGSEDDSLHVSNNYCNKINGPD